MLPNDPLGPIVTILQGLGILLPFVAVVLLFPERTRRWGLGILLGFGIALVVGIVGIVGMFVAYIASPNS